MFTEFLFLAKDYSKHKIPSYKEENNCPVSTMEKALMIKDVQFGRLCELCDIGKNMLN